MRSFLAIAVIIWALGIACGLVSAQQAPPEQQAPLAQQGQKAPRVLQPMPSLADVSRLAARMNSGEDSTLSSPIRIALLVTLLALLPSVLMLTTAFTRIVIVLAFVRQALSTRSIPPNQVVVGLALFLTFFVMAPTLRQINTEAIQPYLRSSIDGAKRPFEQGVRPLRDFMFAQTGEDGPEPVREHERHREPQTQDGRAHLRADPAFVISELKRSFELGFVLFLPFLVVDLVVASVLMSHGHDHAAAGDDLGPAEDTAVRAGGRVAPDRSVPGVQLRRIVRA